MTEGKVVTLRGAIGRPWFFPSVFAALVAILTLVNVSGSSVSVYEISAGKTPSEAGLSYGQARPVRSDEWLVRTPWLMNQVDNGLPSTTASGIGLHDVSVVGDIPAMSLDILVRPHHISSWFLSADRALAAEWWTWHFIMAVGVFALLYSVTRRAGIASGAGVILALSPSTQWWVAPGTFTTVGYGSFAAAFFIMALNHEKRRSRFIFAALAGWAFSCFVCTLYVPWMITTMVIVGLIVLGVIVEKVSSSTVKRQELGRILVAAIVFCAFAVPLILSFALRHFDAMQAVSGTVYPGQRAAERGGTLNPATIFGAPFDYNAFDTQTVTVNGTNQSENSSGVIYLIPVIVALFGLTATRHRILHNQVSAALFSCLTAGIALLSWAILPLPSYVGRFLLLDRVPPGRLPPALAFVSVVVLALFVCFLSAENLRLQRRVAAISVMTFSFVQLWAAGQYRLDQSIIDMWKPVLITAVLASAIYVSFQGRPRIGFSVLLCFGVMQFVHINPIQVGADPLLKNPVSSLVHQVEKSLGSDIGWLTLGGDVYLRGSIEATGARLVSGISRYPNDESWRILDPQGLYEDVWNRYAHLAFEAGELGSDPVMSTPQADVVYVTVDPCDTRLKQLGVDVIVTQDFELSECGTFIDQTVWGSRTIRVFKL